MPNIHMCFVLNLMAAAAQHDAKTTLDAPEPVGVHTPQQVSMNLQLSCLLKISLLQLLRLLS